MNSGSQTLFFLISFFFSILIWVFMLRVLLQLVRADYYNPLCQLITTVTQFPLRYVKKRFLFRIEILPVVIVLILEVVKLCLIFSLFKNFPPIIGLAVFAVVDLFRALLDLYFYMLIIVVIASWLASKYNPIVGALCQLTNPILFWIRRYVPAVAGFDFAPLIAIVIIKVIDTLLLLPFSSGF